MLLGLSVMAQITNPAPYCNSQAENNYNMWDYIKVGGTTHSFGAMGQFGTFNTYKYYNNVVFPSVAAGGTTDIELRAYSPGDGEPIYFSVFIDFNNNNAFEADENVMRNNNTINRALPVFGAMLPNDPTRQPIIINKNIAIPAGATAGIHRMRVVRAGNAANIFGNYDNTFNLGACIDVNQYNYGCVYDFNINITTGLAVNDIEQQKESSIEIYPNPVKDLLMINNPKNEEIKEMKIFSVSGQIVDQRIIDNNLQQINVSRLSKGVYFIDIETSAGNVKKKFIKE